MTRPTILVTGISGLLGPYLADAAREVATVHTTSRTQGDTPCDLSDSTAVRDMIRAVSPHLVLHAAAMTDVDGCERDPDAADRANRVCTDNLARAIGAACTLLYVSTDQVYGDDAGPHREGEEAPVNAYGRSKLAGERAALAHPGGIVARTSFFGPSRTAGRSSLSDFVIRSLSAGERVTLFSDVLFTPLHVTTLSAILIEMFQRGLRGAFNVASRSGFSKADFAIRIAEQRRLSLHSATIGRSTTTPGRAPRPTDLRLDPGRLERALGRPMPLLAQEIARL